MVLLLVACLVLLVESQTIPAVYYNYYFVNRPAGGRDQVERIDANGGNRAVLFDRFNSTLRDSLAFDGTFIYVVQVPNILIRMTIAVPVQVIPLFSMAEGISCVGLGKEGDRTVLLFGVPANPGVFPASLWRTELNGTVAPIKLTEHTGGNCQYVVQYQNMIYWSTDRGNVLQYNTSASTNSSSFIPEAQNVTGGLTSVSGSNLMVFGANGVGPTLTSTPLDVLTKQVAGTTVVTQLSNFTAGSSQLANRTFSCITLNGALVAVTDAGIQLFFTPFSTVGVTRPVRIILSTVSTIRGIATDFASSLSFNALLIVVSLLLALLV